MVAQHAPGFCACTDCIAAFIGPFPLTADGMRARIRSFLFPRYTGELDRERLARMPVFAAAVECDWGQGASVCADCISDTLEYSYGTRRHGEHADEARQWFREAVNAQTAEWGEQGLEVGPDGRLRPICSCDLNPRAVKA